MHVNERAASNVLPTWFTTLGAADYCRLEKCCNLLAFFLASVGNSVSGRGREKKKKQTNKHFLRESYYKEKSLACTQGIILVLM